MEKALKEWHWCPEDKANEILNFFNGLEIQNSEIKLKHAHTECWHYTCLWLPNNMAEKVWSCCSR